MVFDKQSFIRSGVSQCLPTIQSYQFISTSKMLSLRFLNLRRLDLDMHGRSVYWLID